MADNPTPPDAEAVEAIAAEDAADAIERLREDWGDFERPLVPLRDFRPELQFQRRADDVAKWSPKWVQIYIDRFCERLGDEEVIYVIDFWSGQSYVVDCARWPTCPATLGRVNHSGKMAGWQE